MEYQQIINLIENKKFIDAEKLIKEQLKLKENYKLYNLLGITLNYKNEKLEALKAFQKTIEINNTFIPAFKSSLLKLSSDKE